MDSVIPFEDFGGSGPRLHFAHANGYPPGAYGPLFNLLACRFRVLAMRQRPLWPEARPAEIADWRPFAEDLRRFLDEQGWNGIIGAGHSFGATATLRLALREPSRFSGLLLIDPVLFTPAAIRIWRMVTFLGLGQRIHPLVKGALRRRSRFESRAAMWANYRSKPIFNRISDDVLHAYVDSLGCPASDGSVTLCYPAEWEARIYATNMLAEMEIWRRLPTLKPPALVIHGEDSDTFLSAAAGYVKKLLPSVHLVTIPEAGHLVPLERPAAVNAAVNTFYEEMYGSHPNVHTS